MGKEIKVSQTHFSKHQSIIEETDVYDSEGNYLRTEKRWNIPKIINSDVTFQLYFGFKYPKDNWRPTGIIESKSIPLKYIKK
tara:strand:+ start:76 stop:321 length:246 start_codon:yes stop_codon:yes gene_type:complete